MNNSIERKINMAAPIDRVWEALTDYKEFGAWFLVDLDGPFTVGEITRGTFTHPGCEGMAFWAQTIRKDAPEYFSFRWPYDEEISADDKEALENSTLVEFRLEKIASGTRLTVKETGFELMPEQSRLNAIRSNTEGWESQLKNILAYVER